MIDAARKAAMQALLDVLAKGRSLTSSLESARAGLSRPEDRAFAQELAFGVMRWLPRHRLRLGILLKQPMRPRDRDVEVLLLLGLHQLAEMRTPAHAAVHASVELAKQVGKPWAAGLVNAVLRRCLREGFERIDAAVVKADPGAADVLAEAHPHWLIGCLEKDWPDHWRALCQANNARPPMVVRVNRQRSDRQSWIEALAARGMVGTAHPLAPDAVTLEVPCSVEALPGFQEGAVSVQDAAGQRVIDLLDLQPGLRVLDACAAPGSKTGHLLEREPELAEVVAIDHDSERLARLRVGLDRLGLEAQCHVADAGDPSAWWDGRPFDRILLDAPCSATGVIRRHPDIKSLRRPEDLDTLVEAQRRLLSGDWSLLRRGGILVYTTCSVLRRENEAQLERFLAGHADCQRLDNEPAFAVRDDAWIDLGPGPSVGWQVPTGALDMDGFFYGVLKKT